MIMRNSCSAISSSNIKPFPQGPGDKRSSILAHQPYAMSFKDKQKRWSTALKKILNTIVEILPSLQMVRLLVLTEIDSTGGKIRVVK